MEISLAGEVFTLCHEKCLLRHRDQALIIADVHLGKSAHFRKAGIAVPSKILYAEMEKLLTVIHKYNAEKIIFLGDLFHSAHNQSVDLLQQIIDNEIDRQFILIEGNHDIMRPEIYTSLGIEVLPYCIEQDIIYTHEPMNYTTQFNIYGHIHPGVFLSSKGKQSMRLPCFHVGSRHATLPAFGIFTGLAMVEVSEEDTIYVVANETIIKMGKSLSLTGS